MGRLNVGDVLEVMKDGINFSSVVKGEIFIVNKEDGYDLQWPDAFLASSSKLYLWRFNLSHIDLGEFKVIGTTHVAASPTNLVGGAGVTTISTGSSPSIIIKANGGISCPTGNVSVASNNYNAAPPASIYTQLCKHGIAYGYHCIDCLFPYDVTGNEILGQAQMKVEVCECGNKHNPVGQGHSQWCDLYKQEF